MAKYCLNKQTKRVVCRQKYKIEKKVKDHNRKLKKEAKRTKNTNIRKAAKPVSVPNDCPFKDEMLMEAEQRREEIKSEMIKKKAQKKLDKSRKAKKVVEVGVKRKMGVKGDINTVAQRAVVTGEAYDIGVLNEPEAMEAEGPVKDQSYKKYASEVKKTIETADVILEILDARNPLGSRNMNLERSILASGKRLVLVLNKIDLIPKENAAAWLIYLRKIAPTIAFKASTQEQVRNVGRTRSSNLSISTSKCIGADLIMKLLGNYCRNNGVKQSIRVGVIGYPNVGKSSVINSLKRKKSCQVGNTPGMTRHIQEVELDKNIKLIDSPGVVMDLGKDLDTVELILKNAVSVENVEDPELVITAILRRCSTRTLMIHYKIPEFTTQIQFLDMIARKIGRMGKSGITDKKAAAKFVLHEWHDGKLPYHTLPPETNLAITKENEICSSELLTTMSKEFSLDEICEEQIKAVEAMDETTGLSCVYDPSKKPIQEESMETDDVADGKKFSVTAGVNTKQIKHKSTVNLPKKSAIKNPTTFKHDGNVQLNKTINKAAKKVKKQTVKQSKRVEKIADSINNFSM
uniref:CP-type G domain-containing protein n=1 Tax=Rhabditophanes sp. KR3021 TaxID=114890 RepID=A0AC35U8G5_9BILA